MKRYLLYMLLFLTWSLIACDDGKIYDETVIVTGEGRTLKLTGQITGVESWPEEYSVVVAGFGDGEFAVASKSVPASAADGEELEVTLSGISDEVKQVELCVINKLRRKIVSFYQLDCSTISDTIKMEVGTINAGMFHCIQQEVFNNSCTTCHGGSTSAGAGLYLTEGKSYTALVGKKAVKDKAGSLLVKPGEASASFLHKVLNTDVSKGWRIDHSDLGLMPALLTMIDNWIDAGAVEDDPILPAE